MAKEAPQNTWTEEASAYFGDEMVQMSDAQAGEVVATFSELPTTGGDNERAADSSLSPEKKTLFESPAALQQYILEELGDTELAERIAVHPEISAQIVSGEGPLSPDFFSLVRAIAKKNSALAVTLVREAQEQGHLLETNIEVVAGKDASPQDIDRFLLRHYFEINENAVLPASGEKEKTTLDLRTMEYAATALCKIRESYHLPEYTVIPEQVKILDPSALPAKVLGKHDMYGQQALVAAGESIPHVNRVSSIIHELSHAHMYGSIEVWNDEEGKQNIAIRRRGLNVRNTKETEGGTFLNWLNEAVTEELSNRIMNDIPEDHPQLGALIKERNNDVHERLKDHRTHLDRYNRPYWYTVDPKNKEELLSSYDSEKQLMYYLFEKIYKAGKGNFAGKSQEEVDEELFTMLTKGAFTGNILPFGRLFNDTFGRGKFREFGHLQTIEKQKAFIDKL